jgi:hypothetical protein
MPRPYHFLFLSLFLVLSKSAFAQAPAAPTPQVGGAQTAVPLFRAQLPGGVYEVAVRSIVSVSSHEYLVDGVARVVEVNIDTTGSILARFYFIEPNAPAAPAGVGAAAVDKAQQLFTQAADKTGMDAWKKVVKNYPTTTHARTVEYRFQSREDLNKVFEAAEEAFRLQRPKTVKVE